MAEACRHSPGRQTTSLRRPAEAHSPWAEIVMATHFIGYEQTLDLHVGKQKKSHFFLALQTLIFEPLLSVTYILVISFRMELAVLETDSSDTMGPFPVETVMWFLALVDKDEIKRSYFL